MKVEWVKTIDSWKEWKNIAIFACNHWDEKVGLEVFSYLEKQFWLKNKLKIWKVYLIKVNIEACEKNKRFIDDNMNRIWNKEFKKWSYEFRRGEELKSILDDIDIAIDLHSVSKWNDVIWITDIKYLDISKKFLDVETILVDDVWKTWALIWYLIRKWKVAFWLECWNHNSENAYLNWVRNVLNFLIYYWFIDWKIKKEYSDILCLRFYKEIYPKTEKFRFSKDYSWFTKLWKWEIYAYDQDVKYFEKKEVYIWLVAKNPELNDGCWFIFNKI